jgi:hypothetical protein
VIELDPRGRRLRAALAAVLVKGNAPELRLMHACATLGPASGSSSLVWRNQGYQVSLGEHGTARWIAVLYRAGGGHEPVVAAGTAQEATAWRAVQRAAWAAMQHAGEGAR